MSVSAAQRYSGQAAVICVYEGVRSVCIDWGQLDTGNCHQNADLQKVEQAVVKSAWSGHYGFVDAVPPAASIGTRNQTGKKERLRRPAWGFVSPWELSPHSTLVDKAALRPVERCEKRTGLQLQQGP